MNAITVNRLYNEATSFHVHFVLFNKKNTSLHHVKHCYRSGKLKMSKQWFVYLEQLVVEKVRWLIKSTTVLQHLLCARRLFLAIGRSASRWDTGIKSHKLGINNEPRYAETVFGCHKDTSIFWKKCNGSKLLILDG